MDEQKTINIFLASPSDLKEERTVVKEVAKAVTRTNQNSSVKILGWESVRGTAYRPQYAINNLIPESDFMIVLFKERWGSPTGGTEEYTSGTEEELFTALHHLSDRDRRMRDVWVAFFNTDNRDENLTAFKNQLSESTTILYDTFDGDSDLRAKLQSRIQGWIDSHEQKIVRTIKLKTLSGKPVLETMSNYRDGRKLVEMGFHDEGRAQLEKAADNDYLDALMFLSRELMRSKSLDKAQEYAERARDIAIENLELCSPQAAMAFGTLAQLSRRRGNDAKAELILKKSLDVLNPGDDPDTKMAAAKNLDMLGLIAQTNGRAAEARAHFEKALQTRNGLDDRVEQAQSKVNIARLELNEGNVETARIHTNEALDLLADMTPVPLHANCHILACEVAVKEGNNADALKQAIRALDLNRAFENEYGQAISLNAIANCHRRNGDLIDALTNATESLELNTSLSNTHGIEVANRTLDAIKNQMG